nr:front-end fatty acid desaturase group B [Spirobranchus lamarcki]
MGKGGDVAGSHEFMPISWQEIKEKVAEKKKWIVIDKCVYDVGNWMKKHPGGRKIITHFIGQDATEVWNAMHKDKATVAKFLKPLYVGKLKSEESEKTEVERDFEELRQIAINNGWFKINPLFYILHLGHIIALELLAAYILCYWGQGWLPYTLAAVILATAQAQAGWAQHDYGHSSVFESTRLNHIAHHFTVGFIKGASSRWWNFRHFQHHAKPNVIRKDPDISVPWVFLLGEKMAKSWGTKKKGFMPYNQQHNYFAFLGPSILLTIYFHIEVSYFVFKRHYWLDLSMVIAFFTRWDLLFRYSTGMTILSSFGLYMFVRFLESWWFTMVTQMNHIPMVIDDDQDLDWLSQQTIATCNVEPGLFNDWFTGHLNYQVEHHLFPTMPRHNYSKVQPLVESLCKKHGKNYTVKPLGTAFIDIVRSLKKSGQIWFEAYYQT